MAFFLVLLILISLIPNNSYGKRSCVDTFYTTGSKYHDVVLIADCYDTAFGLWYNSRILYKGDTLKIKGYDTKRFGSYLQFARSSNGRYVIMDMIDAGYAETGTEKFKHQVYYCVIIDLKRRCVLKTMQSDCDGDWNIRNQWVAHGEVIFDPRTPK